MIEPKLQQVEKRYQELSDRLIHPETFSDSSELQKIAKEHADLEPLVQKIKEYRKFIREKNETRSFLEGSDSEMKTLAQAELPTLEKRVEEIEKEFKTFCLSRKIPMEIGMSLWRSGLERGGRGGSFRQRIFFECIPDILKK